jgi:subtilisin family serine protease
MKIKTLALAVASLLITFSILPLEPSQAKADKFFRSRNPIPNRYIVVLNPTDENGRESEPLSRAEEFSAAYRMKIERTFDASIKAYATEMTEAEAIRLSEHPSVKYVEEDGVVETQSVQPNAPWGLGRIDQRAGTIPSDTNYEYGPTGAGVTVYIIDTGVWTENPDFNGRAIWGYDSFNDANRITECNGHGTHVAGIAGATTYGVAKNARLVSVKVFPCSGAAAVSDVISGIDWVRRNVVFPAVANMSLSGSRSGALEDAVGELIRSGVTVTAAAGNNGTDACSYSPGHLAEAITVGSTYYTDERPSSTNYGSCLDVFAPGVVIASTWNRPDMPSNSLSGTSMASPHVAGVAALFLEQNPTASPSQVADAIRVNATPDRVTEAGPGSPNLFLFSGFLSDGPPPPPACPGVAYSGRLGVGASNYQSSLAGFAASGGIYSGRLELPDGMTFVLSLEQKKGKLWNTVASSAGTSSVESVAYRGKSGTYRWRIRSVYGSGDYNLCSVTP